MVTITIVTMVVIDNKKTFKVSDEREPTKLTPKNNQHKEIRHCFHGNNHHSYYG
jgi:hypothetical protein